jgi:tRNA/tmRNA/rRNA uracil-C5-methylase (TrmA/RlmC/RlmD family)
MTPALLLQEIREASPRRIPQARPNEMKNFMRYDQWKFSPLSQQLRFKHHTALADKAGGVYRNTTLRTGEQFSSMCRKPSLR